MVESGMILNSKRHAKYLVCYLPLHWGKAKRKASNHTQDTDRCRNIQLYTDLLVIITDVENCSCLSGWVIMDSTRSIRVVISDPSGEICFHSC